MITDSTSLVPRRNAQSVGAGRRLRPLAVPGAVGERAVECPTVFELDELADALAWAAADGRGPSLRADRRRTPSRRPALEGFGYG